MEQSLAQKLNWVTVFVLRADQKEMEEHLLPVSHIRCVAAV
jgi:hypothetical protein